MLSVGSWELGVGCRVSGVVCWENAASREHFEIIEESNRFSLIYVWKQESSGVGSWGLGVESLGVES